MTLPQSLLFQREHIPHYINAITRRRVLHVYRVLHRSLNRLCDSLARSHLKQRAQHSFAAYKYVTEPKKVLALLRQLEERELHWAQGAAALDHKCLAKTLELAFSTYQVKETPLKRVLSNPPQLCDHRSLVYKLNNVQVPSARTFAAHASQRQANQTGNLRAMKEPFWMLAQLLRSNNVRTGANGRKLVFNPEEGQATILTVFGEPVPPSRQANIMRSLYSTFLRDAPRPVHPAVMTHIQNVLRERPPPRKYLRRIQHCAQELYTIDEEGKMTGVKFGPFQDLLALPRQKQL